MNTTKLLLCLFVVLLFHCLLVKSQSIQSRYRIDKLATRVYGDGTIEGSLYNPAGSFMTSKGDLYISETSGIRIVYSNGTYSSITKRSFVYSTIVSGKLASQSIFYTPTRMQISPVNGLLYIIDSFDKKLITLNSKGELNIVLGTKLPTGCIEGATPLNCLINQFNDFKIDPRNGDIYFINQNPNTNIKKLSNNSVTTLATIPSTFTAYSSLSLVNDELYISILSTIYMFNLTSGNLTTFSTISNIPNGLIVDIEFCGNGSYYYASYSDLFYYQKDVNETRLVYSGSFITDISRKVNGSCSEIYVSDSGKNSVYKVYNEKVSRIAGTGEIGSIYENVPSLEGGIVTANTLLLDSNGDLLISDKARIRKISLSTGLISTYAGNGNSTMNDASSFSLNSNIAPSCLAFSKGSRELFFVDQGMFIRKVNNETNMIETFAGSKIPNNKDQDAKLAYVYNPSSVSTLENGDIIVTESTRILKISPEGIMSVLAGGNDRSTKDESTQQNRINPMFGVVYQPTADIYFVDYAVGDIRKYENATRKIVTILKALADSVFGVYSENEIVHVKNYQIWKYNYISKNATVLAGNGKYGLIRDNNNATGNSLSSIYSISVSRSGNVYILENYSIRMISPANNSIITLAGNYKYGISPDGVNAKDNAIDANYIHYSEATGEIFFVESNYIIRKIGLDGKLYTVAGRTITSFPYLVATNPSYLGYLMPISTNSNGDVLFVENDRNRVSMVRRNDSFIQVIVNGNGDGGVGQQLSFPFISKIGISKNDDVYVSSEPVRKISSTGLGSSYVAGSYSYFNKGFIVSELDDSILAHSNYQILKITSNSISVLAGNGNYGTSPDGTVATQSFLSFILSYAIVELPNGEIYFQDGIKLRKIAKNGRLYTVAGSGYSTMDQNSYSDALTSGLDYIQDLIFDSKSGKFYFIAGTASQQVFSMTPYCTNGYVFQDVYKTSCIPVCYGIPSNMSNVCSGNGICALPNTCQCNGLFVGSNCSQTFCDTASGKLNTLVCPSETSNSNSTISSTVQTVSDLQTLNNKTVSFSNVGAIKIDLPSTMANYLSTQVSEPIQIVSVLSKPDSTPISEFNSQDNSTLTMTVLTSVVTLLFIKTSDGKELNVQNLDKPIVISFSNINFTTTSFNSSNLLCSYYDEDSQSWEVDGVETQISILSNKNSVITFSATCKSSHLTSFVVIDHNLKKTLTDTTQKDTTLNLDNTNVIVAAVVSVVGGLCLIGTVGAIIIVVGVVLSRRKRKSSGNQF